MTTLLFSSPRKFSEIFDVPADTSEWALTSEDGPYVKLNSGFTSRRDPASFGSLDRSLTPLTEGAKCLSTYLGVYILAFGSHERDLPRQAFYVGVAGCGQKTPEGVLKRIRKHRVKVTGSNLGRNLSSNGGVSHTEGWRKYAPDRHRYFTMLGIPDQCDDATLVVGKIIGGKNRTSVLEFFEHAIFINKSGVRDRLYELLWNGKVLDPILLTTRSKKSECPDHPIIELWDGGIFDVA